MDMDHLKTTQTLVDPEMNPSKGATRKVRRQETVTVKVEICRSNKPLSAQRRAALDAAMIGLASRLLGPVEKGTC